MRLKENDGIKKTLVRTIDEFRTTLPLCDTERIVPLGNFTVMPETGTMEAKTVKGFQIWLVAPDLRIHLSEYKILELPDSFVGWTASLEWWKSADKMVAWPATCSVGVVTFLIDTLFCKMETKWFYSSCDKTWAALVLMLSL